MMKHLTPQQARQFLQQHEDALFVDCRTDMEFFYVGHPVGAINIEWQRAPDFDVNEQFVDEVQREAGSLARPILLICRSGNRTADAGPALEKAGFTEIADVAEGFEGALDENAHRGTLGGWRRAGLPWEQM